MATKKTYYYKIVESKAQRMGGRKEKADIYAVKYGKIHKIGSVGWNTASFKGVASTVYESLYKKGLVTKTEYKKGNGYYSRRTSKINIESL